MTTYLISIDNELNTYSEWLALFAKQTPGKQLKMMQLTIKSGYLTIV